MNGLPVELIVVVLLGAVWLFNFVLQRAVRRRQAQAAQDQPVPDGIPEDVWHEQPAAAPYSAALYPAALYPAATYAAPRDRFEVPTMWPKRARRRFARQTLLGSRRQIQDAFVVATILGRCRGDEPHEIR